MDGGITSMGNADETMTAAMPRRRATFAGVLGELLITIGLVALLYVAWQMWIGDWIIGAQNNAEGQELSQEWAAADGGAPIAPAASPTPSRTPVAPVTPVTPVVMAQPADGKDFGILHIPRFGSDYAVKMAGGVTRARTLDRGRIGHYPGTPMPGQPGNFAVAAHRMTVGAPFSRLGELHVGDAIVVETETGWYTYRFRTLEYVTPQSVNVLDAVPQTSKKTDGEGYITLTSCSPKWSMAERIVAYGVFESFQPRTAGAPSSLTPVTAS